MPDKVERPACSGCQNRYVHKAADGSLWDQCQIVRNALRYTPAGMSVPPTARSVENWLFDSDYGKKPNYPCCGRVSQTGATLMIKKFERVKNELGLTCEAVGPLGTTVEVSTGSSTPSNVFQTMLALSNIFESTLIDIRTETHYEGYCPTCASQWDEIVFVVRGAVL